MSSRRIATSGFANYRTRHSGTQIAADIRMVIVWGKRNLLPGDYSFWGNELGVQRLPNGDVQIYRVNRMIKPGFWASIYIGWLDSSKGASGLEARRTMVSMSKAMAKPFPLPT